MHRLHSVPASVHVRLRLANPVLLPALPRALEFVQLPNVAQARGLQNDGGFLRREEAVRAEVSEDWGGLRRCIHERPRLLFQQHLLVGL